MKMENETKFVVPDYKKIHEISHRMDCTITEADYDTDHPNRYRIDYIVCDINRYLKNGGVLI